MNYSNFMIIKYFRLRCIVRVIGLDSDAVLTIDNKSNVLEDCINVSINNVTFEGLPTKYVKYSPQCMFNIPIKDLEIVSLSREKDSPLRSESDLGELRQFYRL